jgi:hypothetical protein
MNLGFWVRALATLAAVQAKEKINSVKAKYSSRQAQLGSVKQLHQFGSFPSLDPVLLKRLFCICLSL